MKTLSMDVMGFVSSSLMFSRSLKYCSTVLLLNLLLAVAVATASLMLSMVIAVRFLRCTNVASNSFVWNFGNMMLESQDHS